MHSRRVAALTAVVVLASFALGACGKPGRGEPSDLAKANFAPKSTPTVFPPKSPTAAPSESAAPSGQPSASGGTNNGGGGGNAVTGTSQNKFDPAKLTVKAGTEVTWTLQGFHSVTGGKDGTPDGSSPIKSELGTPTYKVTFDKPGTYPYFCQPHFSLGMTGEIVVT